MAFLSLAKDGDKSEAACLSMIDYIRTSDLTDKDESIYTQIVIDLVKDKFEFPFQSRSGMTIGSVLFKLEELLHRRIAEDYLKLGESADDPFINEDSIVYLNLEFSKLTSKVNRARDLESEQKKRIVLALMDAQKLIFDPRSTYQKVLDGLESAGKSLGRFGENAEPFVNAVERISRSLSMRKEKRLALEKQEAPKQLEHKPTEEDDQC